MANGDEPCLPVGCPKCRSANQVCITHPAHHALGCSGCGESFVVDQTLIQQFYDSDDSAHCMLEEFYRAPLVAYFLNRNMSQVEAEQCQIDVLKRVWETKHPQPGNAPQGYDPHHSSRASFRTWLFAIARHILADHRRPPVLFPDLEGSNLVGGEESIDPTALQRDFDFNRRPAEDEAAAREHRAAVHDCRDKLPPRERLAINVWLEHEGARGVGNILAGELRMHFPAQETSAATASALLNGALELMR
jgi:DNA-directed RNA polymerase specialized sigma24 family protein